MRVLIISRSFFPMNTPRAFRTTELAKEFSRLGHRVTLLTHPNKELREITKKYKIDVLKMPKPKWKTPYFGSHGIAKIINRVCYRILSNYIDFPSCEYYFLVKNALKGQKNYDIIISIAVPHTIHWGVAAAMRINSNLTKTWIADCGDPYLLVENDTFQKPFYFKYLERWWAKKANFITVPVKGAINAYDDEVRKKIRVIPQGFNFDDIEVIIKDVNQNIKNEIPTFAYGGGFIENNRDPRKFLDYLNSLDIEFKFYIYTNKPSLIQKYAESSHNQIIICPIVSRNEFLRVLVKMDFVVNFENIGQKQVPSKLIDYSILKKPILSIHSHSLDQVNINNFLKGNYKGKYLVNDVENYNIKNIVQSFMRLHM